MATGDDTTDGQSFWGGLMTGLNSAANNLPTNPLVNLGLGLMSAAKPFGNLGDSLMQANQATLQNQAARQNMGINAYSLQKQKAMLPVMQQAMEAAVRRMNGGQPNQQSPPSAIPGAISSTSPAGIPPYLAASPSQASQQPPQPLAPNQYRPPAPIGAMGGDPASDLAVGQALAFIPGMKDAADAMQNSPKNAQAAQEYLIKQRQLQTAQPMAVLGSLSTAANADDIVRGDPELNAFWQETAPRLGLNPDRDLTPQNARAFGGFAYNNMASSSQQPAKPMPEIFDQIPGANGQVLQRSRNTGAITEPIPQKLPTYALQKSWDPTTGRDIGIMVQTSPGGSAAPAAALGAPQVPLRPIPQRFAGQSAISPIPPTGSVSPPRNAAGGLGQQATTPVDLGYEKPTDTQLKIATLANYARSSIPAMGQLEASGYRMSPTTRTAVIDAATNDDPSKLSQWLSQEMLANKLSPQDLQYMGSLMPFLQAAGHDMSGARLTTAAMRQAFESTIPVDSKDPAYMATIANNRKQLYSGLLAGTGNAAQVPEFKDTLGADRASLAAAAKNAAPVRVSSPAQARALPPGTLFVTPDGRLKTR